MLDIRTPYTKLFRRSYPTAFDISGLVTGQWVKVVAGIAAVIETGDDVAAMQLKMVISKVSDNSYEGHDTTPAGTITVIDDFGAEYLTDTDGALAAVAEGDWLTVGSTENVDLGILRKALTTEQVVARCVKSSTAGKEIQIVSPFVYYIVVPIT